MKKTRIEALEPMLYGLIQGFGPKKVLIALHNACAHGEVFNEDYDVPEDSLKKLFDGFDLCMDAAKEIEA